MALGAACRQYDSNSSAACVRWLRSVARTLGSCYLEPTDSSDDPNAGRAAPGKPGDHAAGHRQFRADNAAAATYAPMAMRACLVRSHIGFAVSQGTLVPSAPPPASPPASLHDACMLRTVRVGAPVDTCRGALYSATRRPCCLFVAVCHRSMIGGLHGSWEMPVPRGHAAGWPSQT